MNRPIFSKGALSLIPFPNKKHQAWIALVVTSTKYLFGGACTTFLETRGNIS